MLVSVLGCASALAAGHLDSSYGVGGYYADPGPSAGGARPVPIDYSAVDVATNGAVYAVGLGPADSAPNDVCWAVGVTADGRVDADFGAGRAVDFGCRRDVLPTVRAQTDGKVLIAYAPTGQDPAGAVTLAVHRLGADGVADPAFGAGGVTTVQLPIVLAGQPSIGLGSDGSIFVATVGWEAVGGCPGSGCEGSPGHLAAFRLAPDGALDTGRGTGGISVANLDWDPDSVAVPEIRGVAARDGGGMTAVLRGSQRCQSDYYETSCYIDRNSMTLVQVATDASAYTRIVRWTAYDNYFSDSWIEPQESDIYVAGYDDDTGSFFLDRYDLAGDRVGESLPIADYGGRISAIRVGSSGALHAVGWAYNDFGRLQGRDRVGYLLSWLKTLSATGQTVAAYPSVELDFALPVGERAVRVLAEDLLLVVAYAPGELGAARLLLGDGNHPGRMGLVPRSTGAEPGSLVGRSAGLSTTINQRDVTLDFVVQRSGGTQGVVSVTYAIEGNAAAAGAYAPASGTLVWGDGESGPKTVLLDLRSAGPVQAGARVELRLSQPTGGATIGSATHVVSVLPASPGSIGFVDTGAIGVYEGTRSVIGVKRSGGGNGPVSVTLRRIFDAAGGAPASAADFTGADEVTFSWADGETGFKWYELAATLDSLQEPDERLRLELSDVTGGATLGSSSIDVTVYNTQLGGSGGGGSPPAPAGGDNGRGGGGALSPDDLMLLGLLALAAGAARRRWLLTRRSGA